MDGQSKTTEDSNPRPNYHWLVNMHQTKEERQQKYYLAKSLGLNSHWARSLRDWRLNKIERMFHMLFPHHYRNQAQLAPYAQFLLPGFTIDPHGIQQKHYDALQSNSIGFPT